METLIGEHMIVSDAEQAPRLGCKAYGLLSAKPYFAGMFAQPEEFLQRKNIFQ